MDTNKLPEDIPKKPRRSWDKFSTINVDRKSMSRRMRQAEKQSVKHAHRFIIQRIDSLKSSREHIMAWFLAVGLVVAAILGQYVYSAQQDMTAATAPGGTFAEGVVGPIRSLNPLYASSSAEIAASKLLFSSLYTYDETGTLSPDLARRTSVDKTAENYRISLRQDAVWHDGAPVKADDVVFTIETIQNPEVRANLALQNNWRDVTVKKVDDYTVLFTLPPYIAFPHALTFPIIPKHLLADIPPGALGENSFSASPVGSGPFSFKLLQNTESTTGQKVVHMLANERYYAGRPQASRFELHAYLESEQLARAIKSDALTSAVILSSELDTVADVDTYNRNVYPIDNGVYALMNNAAAPFNDRSVRQAIRASLDLDQVRNVAGTDVNHLHLPFINGQVDSRRIPGEPKKDSARATKLLKDAKWTLKEGIWQKNSKPLAFTITTTKNSQYERVANEIARQLREAGMQVTVTVIDDRLTNSNFVGDVLQRRNYQMLVYELQIGADPDVYAYWHSSQLGNSGYNFTSYKNDTSDAALVSARDQIDQRLRNEKYALFARQWLTDAPAIGLYQQSLTYLIKPSATAMGDDAELVTPSEHYSRVQHWTVNRTDVYKTP